MAEKTRQCNILKSSKNQFPSVSHTLEVPNFFKLPKYKCTSFAVNSPSFEFANATWCFRFISPHEQVFDSEKFSVVLVRLKSELKEQSILYTVILLDDEMETRDGSGVHAFGEDCIDLLMMTCCNSKYLYNERDTLTLLIDLICKDSIERTAEQLQHTVDRKITSLSEDFKNVLLNGKDHNLTISVKDKKFQAHQDILRARSEVFQSMLTHDMLEKNTGVVDVSDCDPEAFEQFLYYVYTGKVETLHENNMLGLYYVTDKYNMQQLKEEICDFIMKSINLINVCDVLDLASQRRDVKLLDCASSYFCNNVDDILPTVEWQLFLEKNSTVANELFIKSLKKIRNAKC